MERRHSWTIRPAFPGNAQKITEPSEADFHPSMGNVYVIVTKKGTMYLAIPVLVWSGKAGDYKRKWNLLWWNEAALRNLGRMVPYQKVAAYAPVECSESIFEGITKRVRKKRG